MDVLNLQNDFNPLCKESIVFKKFTFPGGEPHIIIDKTTIKSNAVTLTQRINSFNDLGDLLMAHNALKNVGIEHIEAFIPYLPAARQDRLMQEGEPFSLKVYTDIINSLNLKKIHVLDVHSEVGIALLNNVHPISNVDFIEQVIKEIPKDFCLVAPDAGSQKKIFKLAQQLEVDDVVECSKKRNVKTGKIETFKVYADDLQGKNCLIVDDICDGGQTFIGLAQELKNKGANQLFLAVSHGIFSKGFDELGKHFSKIFTTDSIKKIDNDCGSVIDIKIKST